MSSAIQEPPTSEGRRAGLLAAPWARATAGAVAVIAVVATVGVLTKGGDEPAKVAAAPAPTPAPTCSTTTKHFTPTEVSIPGVSKSIDVLAMQREANGLPGTPPLTTTGKMSMAFDLGNGIRPGDAKGNALLNAHTYPDGSALGNKLLDGLNEGDRILVKGTGGYICYDVTDRVEVPAGVYKRYFDKKGQPQIAIVVCSGKRLGPGIWTKRTVWFASPIA